MNPFDMRSAILSAIMTLINKGIDRNAPVVQNLEKLLIQVDIIEKQVA